ncbi:hypothetical protein CY34DRAFT_19483 [Suillus luteus UH-Slu-Lm8-n1]|uniref:Uncharacterized protein n=1 Tax=Suillus luteus UH-Slu-Lm8-n1 TaxID=930992 RepID=A0A0D0A135_9AGAM|nr:hypothetical protein CY34DRAFT_19483 [Suillus luteus UH-Slu-Lm8-n1]
MKERAAGHFSLHFSLVVVVPSRVNREVLYKTSFVICSLDGVGFTDYVAPSIVRDMDMTSSLLDQQKN